MKSDTEGVAKKTNFFTTVRILLWKHRKQRLRRIGPTLAELFFAVLVFLILLLLKQLLMDIKIMADMGVSRLEILYSPDNKMAWSLMSNVCPGQPVSNSNIHCYGFNNASILLSFADKKKSMRANSGPVLILNFTSLHEEMLPSQLNYTVEVVAREKKPQPLLDLFRIFQSDYVTPRNNTVGANIIWNINKAFLEQVSGEVVKHSLHYHDVAEHTTPEMKVIHSFLVLCSVLAPLSFFLYTASSLVFERRIGLNAMMKFVGVSANAVRFAGLVDTVVFSSIFAVTITILLKITATPILPFSNPIIVVVTFVLYFLTNTSLAFITCSLSVNYQHAESLALLIYLLSFWVNMLWYKRNFGPVFRFFVCCLLPHAPIFLFWDDVTILEDRGAGPTLAHLFEDYRDTGCGTIIVIWIGLVIHLIISQFFAWYLDHVKPGRYGIALPLDFIFKKKFWVKNKKKQRGVNFHVTSEHAGHILKDDRYFEAPPGKKTKIAIKIVQITKINDPCPIPARAEVRAEARAHLGALERTHCWHQGVSLQLTPHSKSPFSPHHKPGDPVEASSKANRKEFTGYRKEPLVALDSVNLDVYKGEITVLLGTNGAGKTTLLSIITGMYSQTKGSVYINGLDHSARFKDLKKDLAYCPQNCIVFSYLTVRENLRFFEWLNSARKSSRPTAEYVIALLKMNEFANNYSYELSDGMKRCLQVACTLVCDAEVLVLDEPTAGMDAQMRHDVWDVLLSLRREKTILFTTTVMEEADALGDRIAVINKGKIKCHGSPKFLKHAIGADFILTVRLLDEALGDLDLRERIKEVIRTAGTSISLTRSTIGWPSELTAQSTQEGHISVHLSANERHLFPTVFDLLEEKRHELKIAHIDVGMSMEQVFLSFVEEDNTEAVDPAMEYSSHVDEILSMERLKRYRLWVQQFKVLTMRAFLFVWMNRFQFIFLQVLVPFFALIIITITSNKSEGFNELPDFGGTVVLYEPVGFRRKDVLTPLAYRYPRVRFSASNDVTTDISHIVSQHRHAYHVFGYKLNGSQTDIYFPIRSQEEYYKAVDIFTGIFMSLHLPYALRSQAVITTVQHQEEYKKNVNEPKNLYLALAWSTWVAFLAIVPLAPLVLLCIEEFYNGVRFHHLLVGCPSSIIWLSKLTAHLIIYNAIVPLTVLSVAGLLEGDESINQIDYLGAMLLMILIYGPAFLLHWYVFSFVMNLRDAITTIYIRCLAAALIAPTFVYFFKEISEYHNNLYLILIPIYIVASLSPMFVCSVGMGRLTLTARNNAVCKLNFHLCPDMEDDVYMPKEVCCSSEDGVPLKYYDGLDSGSIELFVLFMHCLFYYVILILLQLRIIQSFGEMVLRQVAKKRVNRVEDERIKEEGIRVSEKIKSFRDMSIAERQRDDDVLLADNLYKSYGVTSTGKTCRAVKGLSFAVKRGECLGLLGRCGAGKSTTLAMVCGYTSCSAGSSYLYGYFLHDHWGEYVKEISWATIMGLDEFLTGYKNLETLALLYGYRRAHAQRLAVDYLNYMGLTSHSNLLYSAYSPGCVRRLTLCNAVFSKGAAALFDEPCRSVDPHARPLVIRAIKDVLKKQTACVIAEENADWKYIERIWNRVAILNHGEMVALGSVDEIRHDLGSGYSITIKLKVDDAYFVVKDEHDIEASDDSEFSFKSFIPVDATTILKKEFLKLFETGILVDEHISMLYFHVRDPQRRMPYGGMFTKLEALRRKYYVIEDYTLSEVCISEILTRLEHLLSAGSDKQQLRKIETDDIFVPVHEVSQLAELEEFPAVYERPEAPSRNMEAYENETSSDSEISMKIPRSGEFTKKRATMLPGTGPLLRLSVLSSSDSEDLASPNRNQAGRARFEPPKSALARQPSSSSQRSTFSRKSVKMKQRDIIPPEHKLHSSASSQDDQPQSPEQSSSKSKKEDGQPQSPEQSSSKPRNEDEQSQAPEQPSSKSKKDDESQSPEQSSSRPKKEDDQSQSPEPSSSRPENEDDHSQLTEQSSSRSKKEDEQSQSSGQSSSKSKKEDESQSPEQSSSRSKKDDDQSQSSEQSASISKKKDDPLLPEQSSSQPQKDEKNPKRKDGSKEKDNSKKDEDPE